MAYKIGNCTQTGKELFIKDTNGRLNGVKKDCYQADLVFSSGGKVQLILSEEATKNPDIQLIYRELMDPAAESFNLTFPAQTTWNHDGLREYIENNYDDPVALVNIRKHPMNGGL